jgi:hypothetical protein
VSDSEGVPWGGGLAALGMTFGVVALGVVGVSTMQDPSRPTPDAMKELQADKRAAYVSEGPSAGQRGSDEATDSTGCGVAQLEIVHAMHGPNGEAKAFSADQDLTVWLAAVNPCLAEVTFTTPSLCLFDGFTLSSEGADDRSGGTMCAQAVTSWTLAPKGAERVSYQLGNLPVGTYTVRSPFAATGAVAELEFAVQ